MSLDHPAAPPILDFLEQIGIPVTVTAFEGDGLLPGMRVHRGGIEIDPSRPFHLGDLLHEAGHIAVTEPSLRPKLDAVADDPAEEMAAIAWSYAAAVEIGIDPAIVFHGEGYKGGGQYLADAFASGGDPGVPMLEWFGLTSCARNVERSGRAAFPVMTRWLR